PFESLCDYYDLVGGFRPVSLLDCLAYSRKSFHSVACVEARRVNLMLEPGAARQSFLRCHGALCSHQNLVQLALCRMRKISPSRSVSAHCSIVIFRALLQTNQCVLKRRQVDERHA